MPNFTSLAEYLEGLRICNEPHRLRERFKIYDNWHILLYGNSDDLFSKVSGAFRSSDLEAQWYQELVESDDS